MIHIFHATPLHPTWHATGPTTSWRTHVLCKKKKNTVGVGFFISLLFYHLPSILVPDMTVFNHDEFRFQKVGLKYLGRSMEWGCLPSWAGSIKDMGRSAWCLMDFVWRPGRPSPDKISSSKLQDSVADVEDNASTVAQRRYFRMFSENEISGQFPTTNFFLFLKSVYVTFYFWQNNNGFSFSFKAFDFFFTFFCEITCPLIFFIFF